MPTFLFDKIIFGPVKSRKLGVSQESAFYRPPKNCAISIASTVNAGGPMMRLTHG